MKLDILIIKRVIFVSKILLEIFFVAFNSGCCALFDDVLFLIKTIDALNCFNI